MRRRTSIAIAVLALLGIGVAAAALAVLPAQPSSQSQSSSSALETHQITVGVSGSCGSTPESFGNMTLIESPCVSYSFPTGEVAYATLESEPAHEFIRPAFGYQLLYFGTSKTDPSITYAVVNVTGSQEVSGNASSGYQVTYLGERVLNITLLHLQGTSYASVHVSDYPLQQKSVYISYPSVEQGAIEVALANSSVVGLMGGSQYYAQSVGPLSDSNGSGTLVTFSQVDGAGIVDAVVGAAGTSVSSSSTGTRGSTECFPDGYFVSDPWLGVDNASCVARGAT